MRNFLGGSGKKQIAPEPLPEPSLDDLVGPNGQINPDDVVADLRSGLITDAEKRKAQEDNEKEQKAIRKDQESERRGVQNNRAGAVIKEIAAENRGSFDRQQELIAYHEYLAEQDRLAKKLESEQKRQAENRARTEARVATVKVVGRRFVQMIKGPEKPTDAQRYAELAEKKKNGTLDISKELTEYYILQARLGQNATAFAPVDAGQGPTQIRTREERRALDAQNQRVEEPRAVGRVARFEQLRRLRDQGGLPNNQIAELDTLRLEITNARQEAQNLLNQIREMEARPTLTAEEHGILDTLRLQADQRRAEIDELMAVNLERIVQPAPAAETRTDTPTAEIRVVQAGGGRPEEPTPPADPFFEDKAFAKLDKYAEMERIELESLMDMLINKRTGEQPDQLENVTDAELIKLISAHIYNYMMGDVRDLFENNKGAGSREAKLIALRGIIDARFSRGADGQGAGSRMDPRDLQKILASMQARFYSSDTPQNARDAVRIAERNVLDRMAVRVAFDLPQATVLLNNASSVMAAAAVIQRLRREQNEFSNYIADLQRNTNIEQAPAEVTAALEGLIDNMDWLNDIQEAEAINPVHQPDNIIQFPGQEQPDPTGAGALVDAA